MTKWKKVEAENFFGEKRSYKFKLMDCETGLKAWHEHFGSLVEAIPEIEKHFFGEDATVFSMGYTIVKLFSWNVLKDFAKMLLSEAEITIGETTHQLDESGIGEPFTGNPEELYSAIYHAAMLNYEPLIGQLRVEAEENKKKENQG